MIWLRKVDCDTSFKTEQIAIFHLKMRHILIPDAEQFKQYYLRGQQGGSIAGFRGARIQRGYGIGNFFKSIARFAIP